MKALVSRATGNQQTGPETASKGSEESASLSPAGEDCAPAELGSRQELEATPGRCIAGRLCPQTCRGFENTSVTMAAGLKR